MLGELYSTFPCPMYIDPAKYAPSHVVGELLNEEAEFLNHTLNWLQQAGYILIGDLRHNTGGATGVVLTAKGLEALRAVPASLEGQASLGERLVEQTKINSGEGIKALVGEVIGLAVRGVAGIN